MEKIMTQFSYSTKKMGATAGKKKHAACSLHNPPYRYVLTVQHVYCS